jgi:hypothetical protein
MITRGHPKIGGIEFLSKDGVALDPRTFIIPLCLADASGQQLRPLGTCFPFFAKQNIFLTARHVFDVPEIESRNNPEGTFVLHKYGMLLGLHYHPKNGGFARIVRPVQRLWLHPSADLAMGAFATVTFTDTKERLVDKIPMRSFAAPSMDELVCTYAYPNLPKSAGGPSGVAAAMWDARAPQIGYVDNLHPNGRDRIMMPFPCFEASLAVRSGMSGGPVFNSSGHLCGVNSTSFDLSDGAGDPLSYVSMLAPLLSLQLPDLMSKTTLTVQTLIERGF